MAYVYQHIRIDTNTIFYVGIGSDEKGHYSRAKRKSGRSKYWNNIVGKTEYRIEIIKDNISWDEAKVIEQKMIKDIGRDQLCNLTDGGDGVLGWCPSNKTREIWSKQRKGKATFSGKKHSEESKKIMSEKKKGNIPANKGVPMTEEQKNKISESRKGKPSSRRKKVMCIENGVIYNSCEEAERELGLPKSGVNRAASGIRKHTGGFHFKFV